MGIGGGGEVRGLLWGWGLLSLCVCVFWGGGEGGSTSKNRPSHHVSKTVSVNRILGDY